MIFVPFLLLAVGSSQAQTVCEVITLRSGQVMGAPGLPGQPDDIVVRHPTTVNVGELSPTPFTLPGWFAPAQSGPSAVVITPLSTWGVQTLACDPLARWVGHFEPSTGATSASVLYAVPFIVQSDCIQEARIEVCWAVDDRLGDGANPKNPVGLYVNGQPTNPVVSGGAFNAQTVVNRNISGLVQPGLNHLYFYQRNNGTTASGLIFSARIEIVCCHCTPTPANLLLWTPFDESTGGSGTGTRNLTGGPDGVLAGPFPQLGLPGQVDRALCSDQGQVDVPGYPALAHNGDFTLDAWIRPAAQGSPTWRYTILDHREFSPTLPTGWRGCWWYLQGTGGVTSNLTIEVSDGSNVAVAPGPTVTLNNTWQFVASTLRRDCPTPGQICVDHYVYAPTLTHSTLTPAPPITGQVGHAGPLRIANDLVSNSPDLDWFFGCIDELEVIARALPPAEIEKLFKAVAGGKCREFCSIPWDKSFVGNQASIQVPVKICNQTAIPQSYNLTFLPQFCQFSTTPSPVGITSSPNSPILVPAASCSTVWLTIPRPPFTAVGDASCYRMCVTEVTTGATHCCDGSVQLSPFTPVKWPGTWNGALPSPKPAPIGPVVVGNIGPAPATISYQFRVTGPDMQPDMTSISLNELPPGEPVVGAVMIEPGQTAEIDLVGRFVVNDPLRWYSIIFEADIDGTGAYVPIDSILVHNQFEHACPPHLDDNFEHHLPGDVCGSNGWEPWLGGIDVCGEVSVAEAFSGNRSLKIVGSIGGSSGKGDDVVRPLDAEGGRHVVSMMTFVPHGASGSAWVSLLNRYPVDPNWSVVLRINADNGTIRDKDVPGSAIPLIKGQWVPLEIRIDLDADIVDCTYGGVQFVTGKSWVSGSGQPGQARLEAIDLYAGEPGAGGVSGVYFDDVIAAPLCELPTLCYPDCDQSAALDLFDFLCFVNAFNAAHPYADCDASGSLDLFDFLCFVNAFNAGCP